MNEPSFDQFRQLADDEATGGCEIRGELLNIKGIRAQSEQKLAPKIRHAVRTAHGRGRGPVRHRTSTRC